MEGSYFSKVLGVVTVLDGGTLCNLIFEPSHEGTWFSQMRKNKGAGQLYGNRTADMCLCFLIHR